MVSHVYTFKIYKLKISACDAFFLEAKLVCLWKLKWNEWIWILSLDWAGGDAVAPGQSQSRIFCCCGLKKGHADIAQEQRQQVWEMQRFNQAHITMEECVCVRTHQEHKGAEKHCI